MSKRSVSLTAATAVSLALVWGGVAQAQSAAPAAGSNDTIPEKKAPAPDTDISGKGGSLSQKLNDSNGVIHPQGNVDPDIRKSAPQTGTMPVIRPPGSSEQP